MDRRKLALALVFVLALFGAATAVAAVTPDQVKAWWSPWITVAMMVFGTVVKFHPALATWRNTAIGWLNCALFILTSLVAPGLVNAALPGAVAAAGFSFVDVLIRGSVHSGAAMVLWETLGREAFHNWLGFKKPPVPAAPAAAK